MSFWYLFSHHRYQLFTYTFSRDVSFILIRMCWSLACLLYGFENYPKSNKCHDQPFNSGCHWGCWHYIRLRGTKWTYHTWPSGTLLLRKRVCCLSSNIGLVLKYSTKQQSPSVEKLFKMWVSDYLRYDRNRTYGYICYQKKAQFSNVTCRHVIYVPYRFHCRFSYTFAAAQFEIKTSTFKHLMLSESGTILAPSAKLNIEKFEER